MGNSRRHYPWKAESNLLDGRERLHMAELAVQDNQRMRCMDVEIRREGYTYTYETLEELQSLYPEAKFYFIAGADCLLSIENGNVRRRFSGVVP